jgi:H+-translocating NAD(P) transhydrogenase subunit alpha
MCTGIFSDYRRQESTISVHGCIHSVSENIPVHIISFSVVKFFQSKGEVMEANFISQLSIFVLAIFVGYYVVWSVTPALHTPLMAVTNAISSVIIVGALIAVGPAEISLSKIFGFIAMVLAAINIFGGFTVTHRMLAMYKKKK